MARRLTRRMRWPMTIMIAVAYAAAVLVPSLALAAAPSDVARACLTGQHNHGPARADATGHDTGGTTDHGHAGHAAAHHCCAAQCVSALTPAAVAAPLPVGRLVPTAFATAPPADGRGPDRLNRPPILSL